MEDEFKIDNFLTVYRHDFTPKTGGKRSPSAAIPDTDVIAAPFKRYLLPPSRIQPSSDVEHPDSFKERIQKERPNLTILESDIDYNIVETSYEDEMRTLYMHSYCDREAEKPRHAKQQEMEAVHTGVAGTGVVPLTTQRASYRQPTHFGPIFYERAVGAAGCSFTPNAAVRRIMRVRTGDTEYQACIGKLAAFALSLPKRQAQSEKA